MFPAPESQVSFPKLEDEIRRHWRDRQIYEKSLARRADAQRFVFYEGPPTANGLPHPGHCLTRAIKDLFPRYRTMRGQLCERKAGWDTHGLPVEVEVCKELGIHSKEEIEEYGVERFIHLCLESVFRYTQEWERLTERLGFWIHMDEAYVTYHQSYVESVWWALAQLFQRGLLYQGHKIVWWWAQGGTALSSGEVGQGYREVADPSVFVRFPLVDEPETSLIVWTTTPWTLPSNQYAAVHPQVEYARCRVDDGPEKMIVAAALVEALAGKFKCELAVEETFPGTKLVGRRYRPPFDEYYNELGESQGTLHEGGQDFLMWRVVQADFVTIESGTGIVHQAPAFGEVDYEVLQEEMARFADGAGPELICAVGPDGKFTDEFPAYAGRWVKEADKDLSRQLRREGKLVHQEQYLHEYPFCWRAEEDPLIQYPRKSWFIRTTQFRDQMLANNARINWLPEHIRDGRFGNFLESNVDWALSRERYWGTPLPIWLCEKTGHMEAVASYDELLGKPGVSGTEVWEEALRANPDLSPHLKVHKPYIDAVTYDSPQAPGARMRRVPEVIDCWFDSGAMPFAQWGYPQQGSDQFEAQFPADFISEAIDQTRGWFYSQLAISTLLFGASPDETATNAPEHSFPHPFRNCIVLGLMLGEDGGKMSKSKRNYREPNEIFDRYGADALRWYFFANQPPWTSIRYSEQAIRESIPEFLLRLWNTYSFLVIYANIDGFDPAKAVSGDVDQLTSDALSGADGYRDVSERSELDRWIIGELEKATAAVVERMDAYDNFAAAGHLTSFLDALSNWYVRRSRERFWRSGFDADKQDAYWTLYECLLTTSKLIAPFVPFVAEVLWQRLVAGPFGKRAVESVHLCDYPAADSQRMDEALSDQMQLVRDVVSLGRSARMQAQLKVRQPLGKVEIVLANPSQRGWLEDHAALVRDELNVKQLEFPTSAEQYITFKVLPDLKRLGAKLGKRIPALRKTLGEADGASLLASLDRDGEIGLELPDGPVTLDREDVQVRLEPKPGWTAAHNRAAVVVLSTQLDEALVAEGWVNEATHAVQSRRKELDCEYTDRIHLGFVTASEPLRAALQQFEDYVKRETLAVDVAYESLNGAEAKVIKIDDHELDLYVRVAASSGPA